MAGMLPGVECARRRRMWQGGGGGGADPLAPGATRRFSFCLYAAGHGHAGGAAVSSGGKQRSGVMEPVMHGWALDSNAREAKQRLDQKLRSSNRADAAAIKRHHSTGSIKLSRANNGGVGEGSAIMGVQREVYSKKGVMRRLLRWGGRPLRWEAAEQAECAVCLDEFAAGDVLAHLPCGHRFHWSCALPWLQGASSSCPFCRAAVDAAAS